MKYARTPQERRKNLLNSMREKRLNNKDDIQFKKMSELNIIIHDKAYEWYKESRGGIHDEE